MPAQSRRPTEICRASCRCKRPTEVVHSYVCSPVVTPSIALSSHRGDEAYSRKIALGLRSDMTVGRSGGDAARTNGS